VQHDTDAAATDAAAEFSWLPGNAHRQTAQLLHQRHNNSRHAFKIGNFLLLPRISVYFSVPVLSQVPTPASV